MSAHTQNKYFFYQGSTLNTVNQGNKSHRIFSNLASPLAEQQAGEEFECHLISTDNNSSALRTFASQESESHVYTPYGHDRLPRLSNTLLSFNAEPLQHSLNCFLLGNGYRSYAPRLMRFLSPDSLSPFGIGGINAYAYCACDPVNNTDPSGHLIPKALQSALDTFVTPLKKLVIKDQKLYTKQGTQMTLTQEQEKGLLQTGTKVQNGIHENDNLILANKAAAQAYRSAEKIIDDGNAFIKANPVPKHHDSSSKSILAAHTRTYSKQDEARRILATNEAGYNTHRQAEHDLKILLDEYKFIKDVVSALGYIRRS